jgi:alkylhydroperoxidase family enzyme
VEDVGKEGFDEEQIEVAFGVISMFNYFTRVADATGIEFDYQTQLPAFDPDLHQTALPRPGRPASPCRSQRRGLPRDGRLRAAWESWRSYLLEADGPFSPRERHLLACVAAEEVADWEAVDALGGRASLEAGDEASDDRLCSLAEFARKLSREPWRMEQGDLEILRAAGYSEVSILHAISMVAHQNADSRLAAGLLTVSRSMSR